MERKNTMQIVRSVDRAVRLLEALFLAPEGKHLAELSTQLSLHKTTVLRLVRTLVALGLVQREPSTDHYRFEPLRWLTMVCYMRQTMERTDLVQRVLDDLTAGIGEGIVLVVPDFGRHRTILAICSQPDNVVKVDLTTARVAPMHATAVGKALLAHLPPEELEQWVQTPLEPVTTHTVADPARLLQDLQRVREHGYAAAAQENLLGVSDLAVVILDDRGKAVGALGVTVAGEEIPGDKIAAWVPLLRRAGDQISGLLYASGRASGTAKATAAQIEDAQREAADQDIAQSETPLQAVYRMV